MENVLYLKAPGDWINDPNGFIYYKGKYHLFYQYFPCASQWGTMHWGHAVSEDLIHWRHLGIALYPTKDYDQNGIYSGSAIEEEGNLWLYYTAVKYLHCDSNNIHHSDGSGIVQSQVLLISKDGFQFDNVNGKEQIIPPFFDSDIADSCDCRDPKVWRSQGRWYMTLGSTNSKTNQGVLLVMESEDGRNWKPNSRVEDKSLGYILECPDLFEVDGRYVLISSPMGNVTGTEFYENQPTMRLAAFQGVEGILNLDPQQEFFDYGMELYATQSNLDREGRRTVIAWLRMPRDESPERNTASNGRRWNGMMSLPRVVTIRDGVIHTSVHPNVQEFFRTNGEEKDLGDGIVELCCDKFRRIVCTLEEGQNFYLHGVKISLLNGRVQVDRSEAIPKEEKIHTVSSSPDVGESCELEIYMESNIIEVYIDGGRYVITNWIDVDL